MRKPDRSLWKSFASGPLDRLARSFRQNLDPGRPLSALSSGGSILALRGENRIRRAQSASLLTHAMLFAILVFLALNPANEPRRPQLSETGLTGRLSAPPDLLSWLAGGRPAEGGRGSGHDLLPARAGALPPRSPVQWVKPVIPPIRQVELPLPESLLDPSQGPSLTPVGTIGEPWRKESNESTGKGRGHTMGEGDKDGESIGSSEGDWAGRGQVRGGFGAGLIWASCSYCPNPEYTEAGRRQKLQGSVLLQVLVGADGRTGKVRVIRGLGLDLDERAAESVRGWKFKPAHDGSGRPVASWITVEAIYRLF